MYVLKYHEKYLKGNERVFVRFGFCYKIILGRLIMPFNIIGLYCDGSVQDWQKRQHSFLLNSQEKSLSIKNWFLKLKLLVFSTSFLHALYRYCKAVGKRCLILFWPTKRARPFLYYKIDWQLPTIPLLLHRSVDIIIQG